MNGDWNIKIIDVGFRTARDVFIFRRNQFGTEVMQPDGKAIHFTEGSQPLVEPTLRLEPEQLQALADSLSSYGYKPNRGLIEGKLEAQTEHLKDLRKLLKL